MIPPTSLQQAAALLHAEGSMGNMKARVLFAVILGVAIGVAGPALFAQQERQFGGVGLTVFADRDFRGRTATIREDMPNLQAIGLNDLVSSLRVGRGEQWEVCEQDRKSTRLNSSHGYI